MFNIVLKIYRWIFARHIFQKVNLVLFQMSLRGLGILNYENDRVSGEEYLIRKILPIAVKRNNPVFCDIGANIGKYSALLLNQFPCATIYAFEPHPTNYDRLKKNLDPINIRSYNIAVGNEQGELTLYDRADSNGSSHASLHREVISEIHKKNIVTFTVKIEKLDDFAEKEKITYIDFLKIDTEGNELAVLLGASNLLEHKKIGCIHFEFNEMNIISRVFFRDFRKTLCNYDLYRLLPNGLLPICDSPVLNELFAYQNVIALPKNLSESPFRIRWVRRFIWQKRAK